MSNTRFAVLDWDGTLRVGWAVRAWLGVLASRDAKGQPQSKFDALVDAYGRGVLSHDELVEQAARLYVRALAPFDTEELEHLARLHADDALTALHPFTRHLLEHLKALDLRTVVISGAPALLLRAVSETLLIDDVWALEACRQDERWHIVSNPGTASEKARIVAWLAKSGTVAIALGDSVSDEPLLDAASVPVIVGDGALASASNALRLGSNGAGYEAVIEQLRRLPST